MKACEARSDRRHAPAGPRGLTIIECLLAIVIVAMATQALAYVLAGGRVRLEYSEVVLRGVRLGEDLADEILARPYSGSGTSRANWCLDDYDGFEEGPGELADFNGATYDTEDQDCTRRVSVKPDVVSVPELGGFTLVGKRLTVQVVGANGDRATVTRFIAEPYSP